MSGFFGLTVVSICIHVMLGLEWFIVSDEVTGVIFHLESLCFCFHVSFDYTVFTAHCKCIVFIHSFTKRKTIIFKRIQMNDY